MVLFLIRFLGRFQKGKVSLYIGRVKNTQPHSHPERQRKHFFALHVTGSVRMPSHIQARKQALLRVCGRTEEGPRHTRSPFEAYVAWGSGGQPRARALPTHRCVHCTWGCMLQL